MKTLSAIFSVILVLSIALSACSKKEEPAPSTAVYSVNGETTSHQNGTICMSCHMTGGPATEFIWIVAGSVYQTDQITPSPDGILYFWSKPNGIGNLYATLQVDGLGNFFTTASIIPGDSVFPQIKGVSGVIQNMPITTPHGNCNQCHGVSSPVIWVN